jgi:hypothetical protein
VSLKSADRSVLDVVAFFARYGIEVGLLVPTPTGLDKGIMDAHASLRDYLLSKGVHDYKDQPQGQDNKKVVDAWIVGQNALNQTKASLYRPTTKDGDPRIWFYGLKDHCQPGNVLAVIAVAEGLYVLNASDLELLRSAGAAGSPLGGLVARLRQKGNPAADELLGLLKDVCARGFIPTMRSGDTGVGFTLEALLGIRANSSQKPDFKGIEIKSGRVGSRGLAASRSSLFSSKPDWVNSAIKKPLELLDTHGYKADDGVRRLACTLCNAPNSLGFFLEVDAEPDVLHAMRNVASRPEKLVQWALPHLRRRLSEKHRETFWVKARTRNGGAGEEFHYYEVQHTMGPLVSNFAALIESGHIEFDFTFKEAFRKNGKRWAREHGYLFKIDSRDRELLMPAFATHALVA